MRQYKLLVIFSIFCNILSSQSFHDTQGKLEVSGAGQATYTLPIALPPSIQSVGPTINLLYASGQSGGIAGQGWNINSISTISRIATRLDIDGFIDGVDFDDNDKLALDGQRLLLKEGTYWSDGSVYETEIQSNLKIELKGSGSSIYFIVTNPDGSRSWYGNYGVNATDLTAFYITRYEDSNGNFITYDYNLSGHIVGNSPSAYSLSIKEIKFSANVNGSPTPLNSIQFTYKPLSKGSEKAYLNGVEIVRVDLLDKIEVKTNDLLFRRYQLTYYPPNFYQNDRVQSIQELNGSLEGANPVNFEYDTTLPSFTVNPNYVDTVAESNPGYTYGKIGGDINGDGVMNFVWANRISRDWTGSMVLPFVSDPRKTLFIKAPINNILDQRQPLLNIEETTTNLNFKVYKQNNSEGFDNFYTKTIPFDNNISINTALNSYTEYANVNDFHYPNDCVDLTMKTSNSYLGGDFNGDGISELLISTTVNERYHYELHYNLYTHSPPGCQRILTSDHVDFYILDMNPSASTTLGDKGYVKVDNLPYLQTVNQIDRKFIQDFNGDGKDDILIIKPDHSYAVITFNQLTSAPWVQAEIIGQGTFYFSFYDAKDYLFGDFNGDGKMDMMHPNVTGVGCEDQAYCSIWYTYYSNPKPDHGDFFEIVSQSITPYMPYKEYDHQSYSNRYMALDTNKDGKADLVRVESRSYSTTNFWDMEHADDQRNSFRIYSFTKLQNGFAADFISPFYGDNIPNGNIAYPVAAHQRGDMTDYDLVLYRPGANLSGANYNATFNINFTQDFTKDNSLKKITQSGGGIVDEIEYVPMDGTGGVYSSYTAQGYPLMKIIRLSSSRIVSKLKNTSNGIVKYQDFKYQDYVVDVNRGAIGFQKVARSSWYRTTADKKIWNASEYLAFSYRGALVRTYSQLLDGSANFTFPFVWTGSVGVLGLMTVMDNSYTPPVTDPISKRFTLLLQSKKTVDFLTNVANETLYQYTTDGYYLPRFAESRSYFGTTLQGSTYTETFFDPAHVTGVGGNYYIGRPSEVRSSKAAYGDYRSSTQKYFYTNGNVTRTEKQPIGDPVTMVEVMTYFPNGNLETKTVSAIGTTTQNQVSPRAISYTYDPSERFVKTTIDAEGILTTNNTFHDRYGLPLSQTNNTFGQTTINIYDNWGKQTQVTDYLGNSVNYYYTKSDGLYTTLQVGGDGSTSKVESNVLGQVIRKGIKDINNNWSYKSLEYDYLGRKKRESEPYFIADTPKWTTFAYDDYSRLINTTSFTDKSTDIAYNYLTVTTDDHTFTRSSTKNANGHVISSTDTPGGTILYSYDADGNLLTTSYNNTSLIVHYDAWGRKTYLKDPSAGEYTYTYNAYGETLTETSLSKGTTTYTLDPVGKPLTKRVLGLTPAEKTDILSTYSYDPIYKWLMNIQVTNLYDGNSNYAYAYDVGSGSTNTKQQKGIVESTPQATFTKELTFDGFGRISTEKSTAAAHGKTATKTIYNEYKNGSHYRIKDTDANGAILWQTDNVNANGQLTNATLGNGIVIENAYDPYWFPKEVWHDKGAVNVMHLTTEFDHERGNLFSRYNSLFDITEGNYYDNLDRLGGSENDNYVNYLNCKFSTGIEGFAALDSNTMVTNYNGKLRVTASGSNGGVSKQLLSGAAVGKSLLIKFDENDIVPTCCTLPTPYCCNNSNLRMLVYEKDPTTGNIVNGYDQLVTEWDNFMYYTVSTYTDIYVKFYIVQNPNTNYGPNLTFSLDNFNVSSSDYVEQTYNDSGTIDTNNLGTYQYDPLKLYQNSSIKLTPDAMAYYSSRGTQTITYNVFKSPIQIKEPGKDVIDFGYNAMQQRNVMYFGNTNVDKLQRPFRKYYSGDGTMEVRYTVATGDVEFVTYIGGDAYSAPLLIKSNGSPITSGNTYYLHRDYLGSILAITDSNGAIVEKRHFDAWGNIVKVQDGAGNDLLGLTFINRGYTGHEHLQGVNLIHMNGRLYDPKLHRFLQPDNFIQDPFNTQNYNRYAYVYNNPLKYTDPSGEFGVGIAVAIAVATYLISSAIQHQNVSALGIIQTAAVAVVSSCAAFGVGAATQTITNFYVKAGVEAVAHGINNGTIQAIQGGKFWNGFACGSISSLGASAWEGGDSVTDNGNYTMSRTVHAGIGAGTGDAGMITFSTVMGGLGASLSGGNFWEGAVTGFIVGAYNHAQHSIANKELRKAGYDPYGDITGVPFEERENYANQMKNRSLSLSKLYNKNGHAPIKYEDYSPDAESEFSDGEVFIHNRSFSTNRNLYFNILHEGVHAWDSFIGNYARWDAYGGGDYRKARAEIHAYDVEYSFGAPIRNPQLYWHYQTIAPNSYFNNYMGFKF